MAKKSSKQRVRSEAREVRSKTPKKVYLKTHHVKPYRKRHFALLLASIIGAVVLLSLLFWYRDSVISGLASAKEFVSTLFDEADHTGQQLKVVSTHGVSLSLDQNAYYASAVDTSSGRLYVGSELAKTQPYTLIRVAPSLTGGDIKRDVQPTFTLTIRLGEANNTSNADTVSLSDAGIQTTQLSKLSSSMATYGGVQFTHTVWQSQPTSDILANLKPEYSTYVASVDGNLITIVVAHGLTSAAKDTSFDAILSSLEFGKNVSLSSFGQVSAVKTPAVAVTPSKAISLLDFVTNTQQAYAASNQVSVSDSEKIGALYGPAVVKIYNFYCMDIVIYDKHTLHVCDGGMGSGFIMTGDGYVGTNGHVATADPQGLVIYWAIYDALNKSDFRSLDNLGALAGLSESDFVGKTVQEAVAIYVDALGKLDHSRFTTSNYMQNLLVNVTSTPPDMTKLTNDTVAYQEYPSDDNVVRATLVDSDFNQAESNFTDKLKASDVALLKLESGSNYPTVKLGSVNDVSQGSDISIIGFPGSASDNGLVATDTTTSTLTNGKVTAVKNASGSDKKLIETDTTIAHGNSGGPVIDDDGGVVGLATYTLDGSGSGNGVYNYIRDIADLEALMTTHNVTATASQTQIAWENGINKYYQSHYSSALTYFNEVKSLYPNHNKVAEFIASAEKHIANGDDVSEFPMWILWAGAGVLILIAGASVFLIVRHKKHHNVYKAGVAQGTVAPGVSTDGTHQTVVVTPGQPTVQPHTTEPAAFNPFAPPSSGTPGTPSEPTASSPTSAPVMPSGSAPGSEQPPKIQ